MMWSHRAGASYDNAYKNNASRGAGKKPWSMVNGLVKTTTVDRPSVIAQFSDALTNSYSAAWTQSTEILTGFRHGGAANYLFWDNHLVAPKWTQVSLMKSGQTAFDYVEAWRWPWW